MELQDEEEPSVTPESSAPEATHVKIYSRIRKLMPWEPTEVSCKRVNRTTVQNKHGRHSNNYTFSKTFGMKASNEDVYAEVCEPLVRRCLEGYNSVLIAYGQTGSGKTHTLIGKKSRDITGILQMSLRQLLLVNHTSSTPNPSDTPSDALDALGLSAASSAPTAGSGASGSPKNSKNGKNGKNKLTLSLSAVEAYGTHLGKIELFDLFDGRNKDPLNWRKKVGSSGFDPTKLVCHKVTSLEQCSARIVEAQQASHFAPTGKNPESSRGHTIFIATIKHSADDSNKQMTNYFVCVDLAGSEGESAFTESFVSKVDATTLMARRLEAGVINNGLSELQIMFKELKNTSKLSDVKGVGLRRVLHAYIDSQCMISVLFTISPAFTNSKATTSTLRFAVRTGMIKVKPVKVQGKTVRSKQDIERQKRDLLETRDRNERLLVQVQQLQQQAQDQMRELAEARQSAQDAVQAQQQTQKTLEATQQTLQALEQLQQQQQQQKSLQNSPNLQSQAPTMPLVREASPASFSNPFMHIDSDGEAKDDDGHLPRPVSRVTSAASAASVEAVNTHNLKELETRTEELREARERSEELQRRAEGLQSELSREKKACAHLDQKAGELRRELTQAAEQRQQLEQTLFEDKQQMRGLQHELQALREENAGLKQQNSKLSDDVKALQQELEASKKGGSKGGKSSRRTSRLSKRNSSASGQSPALMSVNAKEGKLGKFGKLGNSDSSNSGADRTADCTDSKVFMERDAFNKQLAFRTEYLKIHQNSQTPGQWFGSFAKQKNALPPLHEAQQTQRMQQRAPQMQQNPWLQPQTQGQTLQQMQQMRQQQQMQQMQQMQQTQQNYAPAQTRMANNYDVSLNVGGQQKDLLDVSGLESMIQSSLTQPSLTQPSMDSMRKDVIDDVIVGDSDAESASESDDSSDDARSIIADNLDEKEVDARIEELQSQRVAKSMDLQLIMDTFNRDLYDADDPDPAMVDMMRRSSRSGSRRNSRLAGAGLKLGNLISTFKNVMISNSPKVSYEENGGEEMKYQASIQQSSTKLAKVESLSDSLAMDLAVDLRDKAKDGDGTKRRGRNSSKGMKMRPMRPRKSTKSDAVLLSDGGADGNDEGNNNVNDKSALLNTNSNSSEWKE